MSINVNNEILNRIANALERISPPPIESKDLDISDGFVFEANTNYLKPVNQINRIPIDLLKGLEPQKKILINNTNNLLILM